MSLINSKKFEDVIEFSKKIRKLVVITRGEKGALAIKNNEVFETTAPRNLKIKDLTGAGDLFASGFLHGYLNEKSLKERKNKLIYPSSNNLNYFGRHFGTFN